MRWAAGPTSVGAGSRAATKRRMRCRRAFCSGTPPRSEGDEVAAEPATVGAGSRAATKRHRIPPAFSMLAFLCLLTPVPCLLHRRHPPRVRKPATPPARIDEDPSFQLRGTRRMGRAGNQTPIICGAGRACAVAVGGASGRCYSTPGGVRPPPGLLNKLEQPCGSARCMVSLPGAVPRIVLAEEDEVGGVFLAMRVIQLPAKVGNAVLAEAADHGDVANDDPTPVILTLATTFAVAVIPARTPASR